MAGRISVLDENVINRIAAGEVVDRPASVVKELVENSIDAQASSIQIDIENGGKKLIRIRDNGSGMSHDDAFLALERHATSKLRSEKDLVGISTMGFRGEALASIAAVSRLKLMTSDGSETAGTEIVVEGGVMRKAEQVGMGTGTVVEVRNLFFNVPVRRKFLKAPGVEAGFIQELVTRLALAFPSVAFTYREDDKLKLDTPAVKNTLERIHTLYAKDVRDNLIAVEHSVGQALLRGFVARPPYARSNMRSVQTFVNGRSVRDRLINSAVTRGFANLMERGRYPLAILFVEIPPEDVDVNVHPQKAEVRFVRPQQVYDLIVDGVYKALTGAPFTFPRGPRDPILISPTASVERHLREPKQPADAELDLTQGPFAQPQSAAASTLGTLPHQQARFERARRFSSLGVLGSLPGSFLVLHSDDELIVMDHHAAHERVLFEDLIRCQREGSDVEVQHLLIPVVLEFSPLEARALAVHLGLVRGSGFIIEEFGENDFVVKGVPVWLGNADLNEFFGALLEVILDTAVKGDPEQLKMELLKGMACKAAVKETSAMRPEEIRALLVALDRVGSIEVCPHGRPIVVRFPFYEIRKKMGRK